MFRIAQLHGLNELPDPDKLVGDDAPQIKFLEEIMPQDETAQRTQDQLDVQSGWLKEETYLFKWHDFESEDAARKYLDEIEESKDGGDGDGDDSDEDPGGILDGLTDDEAEEEVTP